MQYFKNLRITAKFILWFLLIALIPLVTVTYISYYSSRRVLEEEVAKSLIAVADNKAGQVEAYLREKKDGVFSLSQMQDVVYAIEQFGAALDKGGMESPAYQETDQKFRPLLSYYQKSSGYEDIFLVNSYGDILFSKSGIEGLKSIYATDQAKESQLVKVFVKANMSENAEISDLECDGKTNKSFVFVAAPVAKGLETIGIVIVKLSSKGVSDIVKDYSGLGKTGETIVAAKIGNEIAFVTPLRFHPEDAFTKRIEVGSAEAPDIQNAIKGENGSSPLVDYRGERVFTVWRCLPSFSWGMVVKMASDEIFASANKLRNTLMGIGLVLLGAVIVTAILIARSVSSPIKELTKVSGVIARGDLRARVKVRAKDEIGELAHSFNEMTDRLVEAKANVEEQKKLLEKANKELDSFTYTASHDLRAPLRGISSFATFLEEDYADKLDAGGRDHIKEIREGAARMGALIDDLLTLSRLSRIKNPYEDVNINTLIGTVTKRIEFDIKKNNVDLRVQNDMPVVRCDRIKMTEVFLNLINNAIKFSSKNNKENPRVEVGYKDDGEFHKFYVKDNGIGIAPEYHEQVFGMFKRLHTNEEYEGTGAGLGIVKRIVDDHDGRVWIESEAGHGATFCFTIPKNLKNHEAEPAPKKKVASHGFIVEEG